MPNKVTSKMNVQLSREITLEEILRSFKDLPKGRSPRVLTDFHRNFLFHYGRLWGMISWKCIRRLLGRVSYRRISTPGYYT